MRAGRFDKLITIQRKTVMQSDSGEPVESWVTFASRRSATIWTPQAGEEAFREPHLVARQKVEWMIRYSADVAALNPLDRVVYPALSESSPEDVPDERNVYDIIAIHEFGRREGFRIITARRPDTT